MTAVLIFIIKIIFHFFKSSIEFYDEGCYNKVNHKLSLIVLLGQQTEVFRVPILRRTLWADKSIWAKTNSCIQQKNKNKTRVDGHTIQRDRPDITTGDEVDNNNSVITHAFFPMKTNWNLSQAIRLLPSSGPPTLSSHIVFFHLLLCKSCI